MSRKPSNAWIRWDRIFLDWRDGYRPQMIAVRENLRRSVEGVSRQITPDQISNHACLYDWPAPWREDAQRNSVRQVG